MSSREGHDEEPERRPPDVVLASILESLRAAATAKERSSLYEKVSMSWPAPIIHLCTKSAHVKVYVTVIAIAIFAVLLCVAITKFLVGVIKVNSCPVSRYVPIWLIISGATSFVQNMSGIFISIWESKRGRLESFSEFFTALFATFWLVWLILGSCWTYSIYDKVVYEEGHPSYCDELAYKFAFVIITLTYVMIGILLCCCICCVVCLCCLNSAAILIS